MYMYVYIPLANIFLILIMKLFKHTEKNEDYNKNPCTYNPGFKNVNILPYFFRSSFFLKK